MRSRRRSVRVERGLSRVSEASCLRWRLEPASSANCCDERLARDLSLEARDVREERDELPLEMLDMRAEVLLEVRDEPRERVCSSASSSQSKDAWSDDLRDLCDEESLRRDARALCWERALERREFAFASSKDTIFVRFANRFSP